jgi:hypothetical protein
MKHFAGAPGPSNITYPLARTGLMAGFLGGSAEVIWVSIFSSLSGGSASEVARGVTATVAPALAAGPLAVPLGLAVHFALAALLGVAVVLALRHLFPALAASWREFALFVLVLGGIWALNFLVILPMVNPGFVALLPFWASLTSKLLFGICAALVLRMTTDARLSRQPDEKE